MLMHKLMAVYPGANAVWYRDDGNGCGFDPQLVDYEPDEFDNITMVEVTTGTWISEWIIVGEGDNPLRYQIGFAENNPWEPPAATIGRKGGRSTSKAKAAAARINGRKGGRPRKQ